MAIYTRCGAPVQIEEAEKRHRWWALYGGRNPRTEVFDSEPTARQLRGAKETSEFDIWWVKARQIGPYPDGSGKATVGKMLDYGKDGWLDENEFRADDGIVEIHRSCEAAATAMAILE